jgi:RNA polymerase sigma factor (sigma-70 family)
VVSDEVTQWLHQLGHGDPQAAEQLWQQYFARLVHFARHKLEGLPRRAADEEDVALSALHSFCRGVAAGRFERVEDREDLWKLLVTITGRKACAQRRRHFAQKRGGGLVRGESALLRLADDQAEPVGIGDVLGREPSPELASLFADQCRALLDALGDESLRQVALYALEGYTTQEIAQRLGCVQRTVERKLHRIKSCWRGRAADE